MNIVVLDGYAANPGDLCWDELQALGECTIYDRTAPAEVLERAAGAEILLTNKTVLTAEYMAALPGGYVLRAIPLSSACRSRRWQAAARWGWPVRCLRRQR